MNLPDYPHSSPIRVPALPTPEPVGDWWRFTWTLTAPGLDRAQLHLPAPYGEMQGFTGVVGLIRNEHGVSLEALSSTRVIDPDVFAYVSLVAWHVRELLGGETALDGIVDHPLFKLVKSL